MNGARHRSREATRLRELTGWQPTVPLREGLQQVIDRLTTRDFVRRSGAYAI
jgi:nucleoside-diphosphate-sugar epimerase